MILIIIAIVQSPPLPLQDVVRRIESTDTGERDRPVKDVVIKDAGELEVDEPFSVEKE